jgi:hypothetical protein
MDSNRLTQELFPKLISTLLVLTLAGFVIHTIAQNVGVGTQNPVFRLDVRGDAHIKGPLTIGDTSANTDYTLPNNDGNSGEVLKTDGSGNVSWQNDIDTDVDGCNGCLDIGQEVVDPGGLSDGDDYEPSHWTRSGSELHPDNPSSDYVVIGSTGQDNNELLGVDNGSASGTEIGIGSIEYLTDQANETTINNRFSPANDNSYDLGSSSLRWQDIYGIDVRATNVYASNEVGVNTTFPDRELHVKQTTTDNSLSGIVLEHNSSGNNWALYHANTDNLWFKFQDNLMSWIDAADGSYNTSDRRLKNEIESMDDVLGKISQLEPTTYYYKNDPDKSKKSVGLIAQDVKEVFPELSMVEQDEEAGYYGINYRQVGVLSLEGVIELNEKYEKQIEEYEERISELEERVEQLEQNSK